VEFIEVLGGRQVAERNISNWLFNLAQQEKTLEVKFCDMLIL
jgi:hypothetical protein